MDGMEASGENERRRTPRFRLALPVNVHVAWRNAPVTVQLIDIGRDGARFRFISEPSKGSEPPAMGFGGGPASAPRASTGPMRLEQEAAFGFVIPGQHVCVANGRVVRVGDDGEFVLSVDRANDAFHGYLVSLAA
jgi:hypothetical protein